MTPVNAASTDDDSRYDLIAIGGGPGGNAAAQQVVQRGGRACLVEAEHLGGTCLNVGCMPTKAMLAAAHAFWRSRNLEAFGLRSGDPHLDGQAFMQRVHEVTQWLREEMNRKVDDIEGLDVVRGRGRWIGPGEVEAQTEEGTLRLRGRAVVLATGSRPIRPDFLPWESPRMMTSRDAIEADDLPESILVLGGGPLGCEFATVYANLGLEVTLLEAKPHLLPRLDPDAGAAVAESLRRHGVHVLTGHSLTSLEDRGSVFCAELEEGQSLNVQKALAAVGREPNLEDIGIEEAGVKTTNGLVSIDNACRTNIETIYAVGDISDTRNHSHLAEKMGIVAGDQVMGHDTTDDRSVVPAGVYTDPEVACVGLCAEQEARCDDCEPSQRASASFSYVGSGTARLYDRECGQCKIIAHRPTGKLLGGMWIGPHAVDMIHELALAIRHDLTVRDLHNTIHAHPSFQEALYVAAETWLEENQQES